MIHVPEKCPSTYLNIYSLPDLITQVTLFPIFKVTLIEIFVCFKPRNLFDQLDKIWSVFSQEVGYNNYLYYKSIPLLHSSDFQAQTLQKSFPPTESLLLRQYHFPQTGTLLLHPQQHLQGALKKESGTLWQNHLTGQCETKP